MMCGPNCEDSLLINISIYSKEAKMNKGNDNGKEEIYGVEYI